VDPEDRLREFREEERDPEKFWKVGRRKSKRAQAPAPVRG